MPRVCAVCQVDISDRDSRAKYCSTSCSKKAYRENNRERVKELKAASYQRNKEHAQAKSKKRYQNKKDEISLRGKRDRAAAKGIDRNDRRCAVCDGDISHRTLKAEYCEPCYQIHEQELNRARENQRYADHREEIKTRVQTYARSPQGWSRRRAWVWRNRGEIREYKRRTYRERVGYIPEGRTCEDCHADISHRGGRAMYCEHCSGERRAERHKESSLRRSHQRRARKLGQQGKVSPRIVAILLELQNRRCAAPWCKASISKKIKRGARKFELDHIMPLVKGGLHDDKNLQLLCYQCHRKKGRKSPDVWYTTHGYLGIVLSPMQAVDAGTEVVLPHFQRPIDN